MHDPSRSSRSSCHKELPNRAPWPQGAAEFHIGEDVNETPGTAGRVEVRSLRQSHGIDKFQNVILRRLVPNSKGRPLYTAHTDRELVMAFRAAIVSHQELYKQHILHCNIGVGSVLIAESRQGFLAEFDLAKKLSGRKEIVDNEQPIPSTSGDGAIQPVNLGVEEKQLEPVVVYPMSGAAQYMAIELLQYNLGLQESFDMTPIEHEVHHDLESFVYLFIYSILRRTHDNAPKESQDTFKIKLENMFGQLRLFDIITQRRILVTYQFSVVSNSKEGLEQHIAQYTGNKVLATLAHELCLMVDDQNPPLNRTRDREYLTYEKVFKAIDKWVVTNEAAKQSKK